MMIKAALLGSCALIKGGCVSLPTECSRVKVREGAAKTRSVHCRVPSSNM